jgi:exopolysaccharide biosynthesis polyprenyl glycosylphosphotransferase
MKKIDLTFLVLRLPVDLIALFLAFYFAYTLRSNIEIPRTIVYMWPLAQYLKFVLVFLPVFILVFALEGLYDVKSQKRGFALLSSIFLGVSTGIAVMVLWVFFSRFLFFSRLIIVYGWVMGVVLVALGRFFLDYFQRFLYRKHRGLKKVLVIGNGLLGERISQMLRKKPELGFEVVKGVDREAIEKLAKIFSRQHFDEVILADPNLPESEALKVLSFCEEHNLDFKMVPNIFRSKTSNVEIGALASYPLLTFKTTPLDNWGKVIKRGLDILFSFLGLIVLIPLFCLVALLIKIDSKGPVFFRQKRIGANKKPFFLIKFRSMVENAPQLYKKLAQKEKKKSIFMRKIEYDPRITRLGRFLRATCIDELPQLFNVLRGEMSLVGPRPLTPEEFKQVESCERKYCYTTYIKPGMTGLWQVSGRTELDDIERLNLDIYYVENWSPLLDLWIILRTPLALLKNRGIY